MRACGNPDLGGRANELLSEVDEAVAELTAPQPATADH